ncbi:MAG: 50S ribosomal protein L24 [Nanoarchaeota archaeon]
MKHFSTTWKGSKKPGKQRKYRSNSMLHIKQKLVHSHLSKELRKKYHKRNVGLRKGDKVKVMRGQFRKLEGRVEKIILKRIKVFVEGIEIKKRDGAKKLVGMHPSNLMITELNLEDKSRQKFFGIK